MNFTAPSCATRAGDKIRWELDRFDLTPDRLTVEVLETVVAERNDTITAQHRGALATLGCRDRSGRFRHRPCLHRQYPALSR